MVGAAPRPPCRYIAVAMRRSAVVLLVLAAATAAGCGATSSDEDSSGDFKGEARLVANTIEDLQSAGSKGDQDEICRDLLARELVRRLARGRSGGCERTVDDALKDTDAFDLTVRSVNVRGTTATARVKQETGDRDRADTLTLVREGRGWRISSFG
jgi:Putative lumazine-binding